MKKQYLKGEVSKSNTGSYQIIASTASVDRQGDSIDQSGWDLTNFKNNPVLIWAHDYSALPIGKVTDIKVVDGELKAEFEFAPEEANPKAEQIKKLYEGGYVNASSVGFIPRERKGHIITRSELLELSLVPVPANQDALRLAISSKSLDVSLIEADLEKGEVQDILNEKETIEQKYENLDKVWEVISAFGSAYCEETTPVEDFNKLLLETIELLTKVANGEEVEAPENSNEPIMDSYLGKKFNSEVKAGRRLSSKTLKKIDEAINSIKGGALVLENLVKEDDQNANSGNEEEVVEEKEVKTGEETVNVPLKMFLESLQGHLRSSDKSLEMANKIANEFIASRSTK